MAWAMLVAVEPPPLLQFPCEYPIKVVAWSSPDLREALDPIFERLAGPDSLQRVSARESGQGRFISITYLIEANGEAQIAAIFEELKRCPQVVMVL